MLHAQGKTWKLYNGDSLFVLADLERERVRVDALITDPPYSSGGAFRGDRTLDTRKKYLSSDSAQAEYLPNFAGDNRDQRSFTIWLGEIAARATRVMLPGSPACVFSDWRQVGAVCDALQVGGFILRGIHPWLKPPGSSRPRMGWFWNPGEFIAVGTLGPMPTDRPGIGCLPGYVTEASSRDREHVTEKPPRVCAWLVSVVTHGGTVLDPFAGSGAIGEAALLSGRQYIGIETEPAYLDIAARRLESIEAAGVQIGLPMGQDEEREQTTLL